MSEATDTPTPEADRSLSCPRCSTPLAAAGDDPAALVCESCGGEFFPATAGRFDFFAEDGNEPETSSPETQGTAAAMGCPICREPMQTVTVGAGAVTRCAICRGYWMEGGEPAAAARETAARGGLGQYLLYSLTLPERAVRSTIGVGAGTARQAAALLVPMAFQSSKTYGLLVNNSLRFLAEDIGGVRAAGDQPAEAAAEEFIARKAVGNFVDLAGLAVLHVSPVWLLAIVSDVAYGTKSYLRELADELKQQGLIDETSTINSIDDVLGALQDATGQTATLFDTPPLSVEQLRESLDSTRKAIQSADLRRMLPEAEVRQYWGEMRSIAEREKMSLIGVSGAVAMNTLQKVGTVSRGALTSVQVVGGLFNRHVIGHYGDSLTAIRDRGLFTTLRESSGPYIEAVGRNFTVATPTWTEALLSGRALKKGLGAIAGWLRRRKDVPPEPPSVEAGGDDQTTTG